MSDKNISEGAVLQPIYDKLQSAIELEFSTIPLYLSAHFSLTEGDPTTKLIHSVVFEEMIHMAINANILAFIGGSPKIKNIQISYPVKGLPGGVEPTLYVGLANLSKNQLEKFLRIETPDSLLSKFIPEFIETYPTISNFYKGIKKTINDNADAVKAAAKSGGPANQVSPNPSFPTFTWKDGDDPLDAIFKGFKEITEQGEGGAGELWDPDDNELSHFGRFAEIYFGQTYEMPNPPERLTPDNLKDFFPKSSEPIAWPNVTNTLAVPSDGYNKILNEDPSSSQVVNDLTSFDAIFSTILFSLDRAWNGPKDPSKVKLNLDAAISNMLNLQSLASNIMTHQIPSDIINSLPKLYPEEIDYLRTYSDLTKPVFYGPRFLNIN